MNYEYQLIVLLKKALNSDHFDYFNFKVNESRYKQCGVTPHFSIENNSIENLLEQILRKNKYWHNQLRKVFW